MNKQLNNHAGTPRLRHLEEFTWVTSPDFDNTMRPADRDHLADITREARMETGGHQGDTQGTFTRHQRHQETPRQHLGDPQAVREKHPGVIKEPPRECQKETQSIQNAPRGDPADDIALYICIDMHLSIAIEHSTMAPTSELLEQTIQSGIKSHHSYLYKYIYIYIYMSISLYIYICESISWAWQSDHKGGWGLRNNLILSLLQGG